MPSTISAPSPYSLGLSIVAQKARQSCEAAARDAYFNMGSSIDAEEYTHFSESAAFFAFAQLGVTEQNVQAMLTTRGDDLVELAVDLLYDELHGDSSMYRDVRRRERERKTGHKATKLRWDLWDQGGIDFDATQAQAPLVFATGAPQEDDIARQQVEALPAILAHLLSEKDARMLVDHYIYNRSYKELAQGIVDEDPALAADPRGFSKAMQRVNVGLARARERAAKRLPSLYAALATEVSA